MLLTISTTHSPATDLGYLLHKNPARLQTEELSFGKAHVFYPEAEAERCTVAILLEVDPIGLVRGRQGPAGEGRQLQQYVNDRPYAANSFLSVALGRLFSTALSGRSKERQALAESIRIPPLPLIYEAMRAFSMLDYEEVRAWLQTTIRLVVDHPNEVAIEPIPEEARTLFRIRVHPKDVGKVIGRQARTAQSIRVLATAMGMKLGSRFKVEIEEEDKKQLMR